MLLKKCQKKTDIFVRYFSMYPRFYTRDVPPAGIKSKQFDGVNGCFQDDVEFKGPNAQLPYRNQRLGEPGVPLHTHGVNDPPLPSNLVFGVSSGSKNFSAADCLKMEPDHETAAHMRFVEAQEKNYERSKAKLGQTRDGVAVIPEELKTRGFGVNTRFGETAGQVIQGTLCDIPNDVTLTPGYQTRRNYDWEKSKINLRTHTFGIKGEGNIDHLNEVMDMTNTTGGTNLVPLPVDRADNNQIVPDPDPVEPWTRTTMRTMTADQLHGTRDPAQRPPAGLSTQAIEFTVGDTIRGMGLMDARGPTEAYRDREVPQDMTFGIRTKPNPFPNPLRGPGRYVALGLSDEDFLLLRDRAHIVPVMVKALALKEEEANQIFDTVSNRFGRDKISISEFHQEFKMQQSQNSI